MQPLSLGQWLQRLERLHFKAIDMGLERVSQVAQALNLYAGLPFIFTVGGTNGKGSTVAFLESILRAGGYSVGAYTSPHLIQFNERVRVNGIDVSDAQLVSAFEQVEQARGGVSLTYFEFTTLAALLIFKQAKLDALVLEVGLGGRLDAVNLWDADVAVITSIDLDHQAFLGDTREKIGLENIGIGRPGRPLVLGESNAPSLVLESLQALGIPFWQAGRDFFFQPHEKDWNFIGKNYEQQRHEQNKLPLPTLFTGNAAAALQALALSPFQLSQEALHAGLKNAALTGRQQIVQHKPDLMLDVGHNPHAAAHLARRLRGAHYRQVHCIIGILRDKVLADTLVELLPLVDCWYPVTLGGERGQGAETIAAELHQAGARVGFLAQSPAQACHRLLQQVAHNDLILVFGSFYTVADVIQYRARMAAVGS
ncbi:MAG TPA: bifunctional tetrahydrofolate synthase/dihydrofolate synthase [Dongiaceae bacterium]|nr:bifunctional tetrahydrofolate synthase/dihydrofolate synthase [Dongiaceae bacterium]